MSEHERKLLELAQRLADREEVDWREASNTLGDESKQLRALRLIQRLGDSHDQGDVPVSGRDPEDQLFAWGPLRVLERIGEGAFGEVYRAYDPRLDRETALKLLTGGGEIGAQFVAEARRLARIRHPNVVTVHGAETYDGRSGLWMELVEGETLRAIVRERGPLGPEEARAIGVTLCRALAAIHEAGLVHGDLKPANVMREEGGRIVLMDLGASAEILSTGETAPSPLLVGTPVVTAPEVLAGGARTRVSDLFSLGALLYNLLTGEYPASAQRLDLIIEEHRRRECVPLRDRRPDLPSPLIEVIERALDPEPDRRFRSAGEMERALLSSADGGTVASQRLPRRRSRRAIRWGGGALAILLTIALVVAVAVLRDSRRSSGTIRSLAVLPLDNLSGDSSREYFVDGMTEALITKLAQLRSLKVISRTSAMRYKGAERSLQEVARELGVEAVLVGSVFSSGEEVRISAQLIDPATDEHLWAQDYEGEMGDVLELQALVAQAIAREIDVALTPAERGRLSGIAEVDDEAYKEHLRGRYFFGQGAMGGFDRALQHFRRAIDLDPSYAAPYGGLALVYMEMGGAGLLPEREAWGLASTAAQSALEIDPDQVEAQVVLGWGRAFWDTRWEEGERLLQGAIQLRPSDPQAHRMYSEYLSCMGRHAEAVDEAELSQELDPFSATVHTAVLRALVMARRYDDAIAASRNAAALEGDHPVSHIILALAYDSKGMHDEALAEYRHLLDHFGSSPDFSLLLAYGYQASGRHSEALETFAEIDLDAVSAFGLALYYAQLGEPQRAVDWLETAHERGEWFLGCLREWPQLDSLRSEHRFRALVDRLGFPD